LINKDKKEVLGQYFRLRQYLKKYREIEKSETWNTIEIDTTSKSFKPGDSSSTIAQIRQKLTVMSDLKTDSKSAIYDEELAKGVLNYKLRNVNLLNKTITKKDIESMNIPISDRIKTIMVNMERCRWISNDISKAKEFIAINIPAFSLTFFIDGKPALISNVVVGKALNKTVVFSADMKYIVFSPYWNIPKSIVDNEIKPGLEKNPNYLAEHNMERDGANIRQKPGPKNSLGLVKFLFPNSNDIYLHDTPAKSLFNREKRAFSHGCIRVEKAKELAEMILEDDNKRFDYPKWRFGKKLTHWQCKISNFKW
jgi:murein L,D-transpeptidase YcbB/YkuD